MRGIICINEETGERKEFHSVNGAASFLRTNFFNVQRAALYNGTFKGWRIFETPDAIRQHIEDLTKQLRILGE